MDTYEALTDQDFRSQGPQAMGWVAANHQSRDPHFSADFLHFLVGIKLISPAGWFLSLFTDKSPQSLDLRLRLKANAEAFRVGFWPCVGHQRACG